MGDIHVWAISLLSFGSGRQFPCFGHKKIRTEPLYLLLSRKLCVQIYRLSLYHTFPTKIYTQNSRKHNINKLKHQRLNSYKSSTQVSSFSTKLIYGIPTINSINIPNEVTKNKIGSLWTDNFRIMHWLTADKMTAQMLSKSASLFSDHALLPLIHLQVTQRKSIITYINLQLDKIKINDLRS